MIEILGTAWQVVLVPPYHPTLMREDGTYTIGVCDNSLKTIYICDTLDNATLWNVIIHELTHATLYMAGYDLDYCCYEELITNFIERYGYIIFKNAVFLYHDLIK